MHLYVHVPFCARRCSYCDFAIAVRRQVPDQDFLDAIRHEWRRVAGPSSSAPVSTLYFGGGTPSLLQPESIATLINDLTSAGRAPDIEITLECNPDDVTLHRAEQWRRAGVNRISLGVQSHDPAVLQWMHRTHGAEQVAPAIVMLRDAGFDNISLDLIFALPTELARDWSDDLQRTLALGPDHVSLYGLTVEPHTPLGRWTARGEVVIAPDDRYATEYLEAQTTLGSAGFEFYEVSNAARVGRRSRHNQAYWSGGDYIGLGPSAHSLTQSERRWNIRDWAPYQAAVVAGQDLVAGRECLDPAQHRLESLYLGLRTVQGVSTKDLPDLLVTTWLGQGWCSVENDRVELTPEGWLRLDALVAAAAAS